MNIKLWLLNGCVPGPEDPHRNEHAELWADGSVHHNRWTDERHYLAAIDGRSCFLAMNVPNPAQYLRQSMQNAFEYAWRMEMNDAEQAVFAYEQENQRLHR